MQVGDQVVRTATGELGVVVSYDGGAFCEAAFGSGRVQIHCSELSVVPSDPGGRLVSGQLGNSEAYGLHVRASFLRHAYQFDPLSGLSNARVEPALHQIYVAHRVTRKLQPRMILADEVGLGKTIEAGLIIKELRARGVLKRCLVVCPASLQLQWKQEMRSKFNEDFEIVDRSAVGYLGQGGRNPFEQRDDVICSLPYAANPARAKQIVDAGWDMVVFDEAHRVRRRRNGKKIVLTQAYRLADELKELTEGLLLLTATPLQLQSFELFSLIELTEPGLFIDESAYERQRRDLPRLNELMKAVQGWGSLSDGDRQRAIQSYHDTLQKVLPKGAEPAAVLADAEAREQLMDRLVEQHPHSGVLVRNRKSVLEGYGSRFSRREARRLIVELTEPELELYRDVSQYILTAYNAAQGQNSAIGFVMVNYRKMLTSSSYALYKSMGRRIGVLSAALKERRAAEGRQPALPKDVLDALMDAEEPSEALASADETAVEHALIEWEIAQLESLTKRLATTHDSKARGLLQIVRTLLADHPNEKILVFTQFVETQEFLRKTLESKGYSVAVFNGRQKLEEKEQAVKAFRTYAQVMISTEAGGEGRNFQFAHIMVNYDLPWNPMRVEQRIGRIDRIGQKKPVLIYNLAAKDTLEEHVLDVLEHRIGLFEESVGSLDPILGEVEKDIQLLVMRHAAHLDDEFRKYEVDIEEQVLCSIA